MFQPRVADLDLGDVENALVRGGIWPGYIRETAPGNLDDLHWAVQCGPRLAVPPESGQSSVAADAQAHWGQVGGLGGCHVGRARRRAMPSRR